jgi:hypothetical protein
VCEFDAKLLMLEKKIPLLGERLDECNNARDRDRRRHHHQRPPAGERVRHGVRIAPQVH